MAVTDFNPGGIVSGPTSIRTTYQGRCPLDGYPLVRIVGDHDLIRSGGLEHVIPAAEAHRAQEVRARIAEAHITEAVPAALQKGRRHP